MLLVYALAGCRLSRFKKILIRIELIKQHATFDVVSIYYSFTKTVQRESNR